MAHGLCQCGCGQAAPRAPQNDRSKGWVKGEPLRFVRNHHLRTPIGGPRPTRWVLNPATECWNWPSSTSAGYGGAHRPDGSQTTAHRYVFERLVGPIPEGMQLDHLCCNRRCVNPAHLEPVTPRENTNRSGHGRQTHCHAGHPLSGANLYVTPSGTRVCKTCRRSRDKRHRGKVLA